MRRAVLLTAGVAMLLGAARAQTIQVDKNNRTIAVTANDKASAPADTAVVTVGFQTYAPDAATAYSQGSTLSNAILDALKKAGVADKAVESQDQKLTYTEFPENDKSTPEQRAQKAVHAVTELDGEGWGQRMRRRSCTRRLKRARMRAGISTGI